MTGLQKTYQIAKADGRPVSEKAKYFVLRYDLNELNSEVEEMHRYACFDALRAYAERIKPYLPELAADLLEEVYELTRVRTPEEIEETTREHIWRGYDQHHSWIEKRWYSVRMPDSSIYEHCWPNAGRMHEVETGLQIAPAEGIDILPAKTHPLDKLDEERPPGPANPPLPKPLVELPGQIVVVVEHNPQCYWHGGCARHPWPPMKVIAEVVDTKLELECTHCKRRALLDRRWGVGNIACEELDRE